MLSKMGLVSSSHGVTSKTVKITSEKTTFECAGFVFSHPDI